MKTKIVAGVIMLCVQFAFGQGAQIPRPSPKASVSQNIGVANIQVNYCRPSLRGRDVFGKLIKYDVVWRAGANEATIISFDYDVKFGGKSIPAGKYALFMIPGKDKWVVILNSEWNQWGAYHYNQQKDIARVEINPLSIPLTELCSYHFTEVTKTKGILNMDWETTRISVPIETATHDHTLAEIKKATDASRDYWYTYSAAAQYHFYERKDAEKAIEYIDIAIALKAPNPAPWMLKSQILESQKKYKEAIEQAEKALEVSQKLNFWFEIEENEEKIKEWKKKIK